MIADVIEMMRAARVEPERGMVYTDGKTSWRLLAWSGGWEALPLDASDASGWCDIGKPWTWSLVPDLTDRATFLLCCDEAERRGVTFLDAGDGSSGMWGLPRARNITQWDAPLRPALIAALARALRDSA